jgi:hypothetical protein
VTAARLWRWRAGDGQCVAQSGARLEMRVGLHVGCNIERGGIVAYNGPGRQCASAWACGNADDRLFPWGFKLIQMKFKLY